MKIVELQKGNEYLEEGIKVFWKVWGTEDNYKFYENCILHSAETSEDLPRFYVAIENGIIIGTYAILRNDINSRQDLCPWFACLFVDREYRGQEIGEKLLEHGLSEAAKKGYKKLYLTTDLENYYEKYRWNHNGIAYGPSGGHIKIYEKSTGLYIQKEFMA
ncbi:GNAT family N-acetyltransferase [Neobacillus sp. 3P2-tot-E-2]|uniref:GNAT family N-acetyltransferase n=1 Tax=Neobacillus sp. 3P2-tot-E-2 TaxID=3132212 RepID=UPI0039A3D8DB